MFYRVFVLSVMIVLSFIFLESEIILHNTSKDLKNGVEVNKINEILIGYQFSNKEKADFKSFLSYFWQSGHYPYLYFVYEKDGSALFSNPDENPDNSPIDMRTRPWYIAGKENGKNGIIGPYIGHFPPHEEIFFYYYPVYVNNELIGVGDYDIKMEKVMTKTIGLLSVKAIHLDEHEGLIFKFHISPTNFLNLIVLFFLSANISFIFFKTNYLVLCYFKSFNSCTLTGLKERRTFKSKKLDNRVKAFCFLDIDNFKDINDTYGHDIGDEVIIAFANCLKESIRDTDVAFRWGGEEFLIILRCKANDNNIDIYNILERLRVSTEAIDVNGIPKFTVSIGYSVYDSNTNVKELIKKADAALYKAKRTGKNKVCEYKSQMPYE